MVAISDLFPPAPTLTEHNLPSQFNRVFIITGAASGVGFELAKIIYSKGGAVYVTGRSSKRAADAIEKIKLQVPQAKGRLEPMIFDLADLASIKPAVQKFLAKESRLDALVHNAGVMVPPAGSKTKVGHDLEMSTHCLGPFLLTTLLEDIMRRTAASAPQTPYQVRIVWVATLLGISTPAGGMQFEDDGTPKVLKGMENYVETKIGGVWLAAKFAERLDKNGIMSLSVHPGFLRTNLQNGLPAPVRAIASLTFKKPIWGAYTELYATFSSELKATNNGGHVVSWGRVAQLSQEVTDGLRESSDGGSSKADKLWKYCERETEALM